MRRIRRQLIVGGVGVIAMFGLLASAGSGAPPSCDLTQLQLRDATINQGLGSYDRLVRGKETLVRMYLSMPSCHDNNDSIQITGGKLTASGGGATLFPAPGIDGTPSPVSTFPTAATYATAPLNDAPADVKFVVPGANLTPTTTESYTASFNANITFRYKKTATDPGVTTSRTFTAFRTKTVEKRTNALRILVVPMGNPANPYGTRVPVYGGRGRSRTGCRRFPGSSPFRAASARSEPLGRNPLCDRLHAARPPRILNADGKLCGTQSNFNTIKGQLAQFLVSWNAANPARAGRSRRRRGIGGQSLGRASTAPRAWPR